LKVAFINSVAGFGSTGRIVVDQYNTLVQNGHTAFMAYGRNMGDRLQSAYRMGTELSMLVSVAQTRLFDTHGFNNRLATHKLLKKLDEFKPDILHLHNLHGYYINVKLLFAYIKKHNLPVVWNLHDCWTFTGHCPHFEYVQCDQWLTGCEKCPQKREYPASFCLDSCHKNYILKKAAFNLPEKMTFVVPSQWLSGMLAQSFLSGYKTKTIPTGIDLSVFTPTPSDLRKALNLENKFVALAAASKFSDRKGYHDLITLAKHLPDDIRLVLLGLSDAQIKSLPPNIVGIGRVGSAKEMAKVYTMADVLINPTKEDTFPTVNLESLACGTPVITYDSGGSGDMLDKTCGVVVKRDDIDGLKEALSAMKKTPLVANACLKKATAYDKQIQLKKYLNVYNELLN